MSATALATPAHWIRPKRVVTAHGVRSGGAREFQLVCGAGDFELDVVIRSFQEMFETMGQVTSGDSIYEPVADLSVQLVNADGEAISDAEATNRFGEFEAGADVSGPVGLRLGDDPDAPCVLLWEDDE